jgi:hypothetical protein
MGEIGPAQLLGRRLARIIRAPVLNPDLCRNAIVLLDQDPDEDEGYPYPSIKKVVYSPYPRRSFLQFEGDVVGLTLAFLFRALGCDAEFLPRLEYGNGQKGLLSVCHLEGIDPEGLAEALGIPQPEEEEPAPEGTTEENGGEPASD